jgi:GT2 family glycosyltransferase
MTSSRPNGPCLNIHAVMTCHNRSASTEASLRALFLNQQPGLRVSATVVDAGSTDDTRAVIVKISPNIEVIEASSEVYWNEGMRLAWESARCMKPDFYLWLNDDLNLRPGSLRGLLTQYREFSERHRGRVIVVGKTVRPGSHEVTYGGYRRASRFSRIRWRRLTDGEVECDTMNGNCVLLPAACASEVGLNSPDFRHSMGDIDYGLRARKEGYCIVEFAEPVGVQDKNSNDVYNGSRVSVTISGIHKLFTHPKALPAREWWLFCQMHAGPFWLLNFVSRYLKVIDFHWWAQRGSRGS